MKNPGSIVGGGYRPKVAFGAWIRRALLPAFCLAIIAYFMVHALFGESGYFALNGIRAEHAQLLQQKAELQARKAELTREIHLLDPGGVNPDFADELIRRHLGVIRPDEVIVPLPEAHGETRTDRAR